MMAQVHMDTLMHYACAAVSADFTELDRNEH